MKFHYLVYNPILWESHIKYLNISNCSTLRRTQKTEFCLKQPGISGVFPKNVAAKYSKIEEFRGRPRESFILEHLELSKTPKMMKVIREHVWINVLFKFLHYLHQAWNYDGKR